MKQLTKKIFIFKIIMVKLMKKIKINDKKTRNIAIIVLIVIIVLTIIFVSGIFKIKYRVSKDVVTQITTEPEEIEWLNEE